MKIKIINPLFNYYNNHPNNNPLMNLKNIELVYDDKKNDLYLKSKKEMKKHHQIGHFFLNKSKFIIDKYFIFKKLNLNEKLLVKLNIDLFTLYCLYIFKNIKENNNDLFSNYLKDILMRYPTFNLPINWNTKNLNDLKPSYLLIHTKKRNNELAVLFKNMKDNELNYLNILNLNDLNDISFSKFKYYSSILYSKSILIKGSDNKIKNIKIYPFIDLLDRYETNKKQEEEENVLVNSLKEQETEKSLILIKRDIKENIILKKNELSSNSHLLVDKGVCYENNEISLTYYSLKEELNKQFENIKNQNLKKNIKILLKKKNLLNLDVIQLRDDTHPYDMDPRILLYLRFILIKDYYQVMPKLDCQMKMKEKC
eukprot:gene2440-3151_t